jgi:quinol monooxygenase YgiN
MIVRIVKMTFAHAYVDEFITLTQKIKPKILAFDGCQQLDILRDVSQDNIFFSYSLWESEDYLNHYRYSEFFKSTWRTVRQWFSEKPEAWSTMIVQN